MVPSLPATASASSSNERNETKRNERASKRASERQSTPEAPRRQRLPESDRVRVVARHDPVVEALLAVVHAAAGRHASRGGLAWRLWRCVECVRACVRRAQWRLMDVFNGTTGPWAACVRASSLRRPTLQMYACRIQTRKHSQGSTRSFVRSSTKQALTR